MKLNLWDWLQRFILVNLLPFALSIVIKTYFFSPVMIFLGNESFLCLENRLVTKVMQSSLFFSLRICWSQMLSSLTFSIFSSGGRWWIKMCWGQVLILEYFSADYILPIFLKHLDWGVKSALVWIHISMIFCKNETLSFFNICEDFV